MNTRSMMRRSALTITLTGAVLAVGSTTHAHEAGNTIVRAGVAGSRVTTDLGYRAGGWATKTAPYIIGGLKKSDVQAGLDLTYMVTDHIGVDFMLTSPFKHKYTVDRQPLGIFFPPPGPWSPTTALTYTAATIKQMPLMLTGLYFPMDKQAAFQPYVGAGVHYTITSTKFTNQFKLDLTALGLTAAQIDNEEKNLSKNRWGITALAGADYNFNNNWLANAQVRYLRMASVGRWVYMAGVGYRF